MKNSFCLVLIAAAVVGLFSFPVRAADYPSAEIAYQQMLNSDRPESEVFLRSVRLKRIRSSAQRFLREFDKHLDELLATRHRGVRDYLEHSSYLRLLAARQLKDQEEDILEYALERAQESRKQALLARTLSEAVKNFNDPVQEFTEDDTGLLAEIDALVPFIKKQVIEPNFARAFRKDLPGFKEVYPSSGGPGQISGQEFTPNRYAITFDDGPSSEHTPEILKALTDHGLKATFFWLARATTKYPDVVQKVKQADMILANHSFHHVLLSKATDEQIAEEVLRAQQELTKDYGFAPQYFRCPYGACGAEGSKVRQTIADEKMISVIWNIDSIDWQDRNWHSVLERVQKQMKLRGRGIILFHDIHPQSVAASNHLMEELAKGVKAKTHRVLTVKQAIEELTSEGGMK